MKTLSWKQKQEARLYPNRERIVQRVLIGVFLFWEAIAAIIIIKG